MSGMKARTTMKDIARAAGVSSVTVHKAIYSKKGVSSETRDKIPEARRGHGLFGERRRVVPQAGGSAHCGGSAERLQPGELFLPQHVGRNRQG